MGKKKVKGSQDLASLASNSSPILEIKYTEPLFTFLCHPEQPLLFSGLASGHIFCHRYDAQLLQKNMKKEEALAAKVKDDPSAERKKFWAVVEAKEDGSSDRDGFKLMWKTKRHKGSVRSMCLDADGTHIYSIGAENVLKKAKSETGKVVKKVQLSKDSSVSYTKIVRSVTHPYLLLGDEDGNIALLDSETLEIKNTIRNIHSGDAINDIFQFSGKSVHRYISLGQTTLAHWDARESNESDFKIPSDDLEVKRKVRLSEDQEDEILCGTFVDRQDGENLVCGMGEGVLTLWKPKKNNLVDQVSRIKVKKNESLDCIVPTLQDDDCVWTGCSDGQVYKVNVKSGKIVEIRKHSSLDEVSFLDLDFEYRLVSGGMDKVKVWEFVGDEDEEDAEPEAGSSSDSDIDADEKGQEDSESEGQEESDEEDQDDSDEEDQDDSEADSSSSDEGELVGLSKEELLKELDKDLVDSDEEKESLPQKRAASKERDAGKATKKQKQKQKQKPLTAKQLRNLQKHEHGIKRFDGL